MTLSAILFAGLDEAEDLWRQVEGEADLHVYQTFDWLKDWYELIGKPNGVEPCLIAVHDERQRPLMLLPLAVERQGLWRRLVWMGADFFDYHAPILMPDAERRSLNFCDIWAVVEAKLPRVDYADFQRQPEIIGDQANPMLGGQGTPCTHGAHYTNLVGEWPSYYASKRGKRTRHNDRRKRKKLQNEGNVGFVVAKSEDDIDRLLGALITQKRAYADARGERCLITQSGYPAFLRRLAERGIEDGSLLLCGLDLDGEILAAQWGAVHQKRLYSIVSSYSRGKHGKLSAGDMLLHDMMRWCFDNGIDCFDFTYGDESYKEAWCEHRIMLYRTAIPLTVRGAVYVCALKGVTKGVRWAKNREWLVSLHRSVRKMVHSS